MKTQAIRLNLFDAVEDLAPEHPPCWHDRSSWRLQSGPRWAARIGMAPCAVKNTQAVTMSHWTACADWRAQADDVVTARLEWLQAKGLAPRSGSFPASANAGNWNRPVGLLHGAAKGVDPT